MRRPWRQASSLREKPWRLLRSGRSVKKQTPGQGWSTAPASSGSRARFSFPRLRRIEVRRLIRENVFECAVSKVGDAIGHAVPQPEVDDEIFILEACLDFARLRLFRGDEVGVELLRPVVVLVVVANVGEITQYPGNREIAG